MRLYTSKTPELVKPLYKDFLWKVSTTQKVLFLTFDDGPIPEVTPQVLEILAEYQARATFFCIGDNIRKHPEVFQQVKNQHCIGNHTYNHLNGWKTDTLPYLRNFLRCQEQTQTKWYRPPYGKITRAQASALKGRYEIVMWDVLSADFDSSISKEKCLNNVVKNVEPGSIVVFHDSLKAADRMLYALPKVLAHFAANGYVFKGLDEV